MENEKSIMELLEELKDHLSDSFPDEKTREKMVKALVFQMIEG